MAYYGFIVPGWGEKWCLGKAEGHIYQEAVFTDTNTRSHDKQGAVRETQFMQREAEELQECTWSSEGCRGSVVATGTDPASATEGQAHSSEGAGRVPLGGCSSPPQDRAS